MKSTPTTMLFLGLAGLLIGWIAGESTGLPPGPAQPVSVGTINTGDVVAIRTLSLREGVDPEAFEQFVAEEFAPVFAQYLPGFEVFVMKGDRGVNKGGYMLVYVFDSVYTRDFYWPEEGGGLSEGGRAAWEAQGGQLQQLFEQLGSRAEVTTEYTDYVLIP